jgi:hypothetical protein
MFLLAQSKQIGGNMSKVEKVVQAIKDLIGDAPDWAVELDNQFGTDDWRPSLPVLLELLKIDSDPKALENDLSKELNKQGDDLRREVAARITAELIIKKYKVFTEPNVPEPTTVEPDPTTPSSEPEATLEHETAIEPVPEPKKRNTKKDK